MCPVSPHLDPHYVHPHPFLNHNPIAIKPPAERSDQVEPLREDSHPKSDGDDSARTAKIVEVQNSTQTSQTAVETIRTCQTCIQACTELKTRQERLLMRQTPSEQVEMSKTGQTHLIELPEDAQTSRMAAGTMQTGQAYT